MPKAVILFSFKKGDTAPSVSNLTRLEFTKTEGRGRTILSKEFSLDEVELTLNQLKTVKDFIMKSAKVMIASPFRVWKESFKAAKLDPEESTMLAGLAMANTAMSTSAPDAGMAMDEEAAPIRAELQAVESQTQGIVEDDFDLDALISGLANAKLGGRRRKTRRRRSSRRA